MGKRLIETPKGQIKNALHRLFLRSRERAAALKRDNYTCQKCLRKQTMAKGKEFKVQVHHKIGKIPNWDLMIQEIYKHLLCEARYLETLCKPCHKGEHCLECGETKLVKLKIRRKVKLKTRREIKLKVRRRKHAPKTVTEN